MEHLPKDMPESKLMWKLAQDTVLKIFHALETEKDAEKKILDNKDFLIRAFIKGEVERGLIEKLISKLPKKKGLPHHQLRFKTKAGKEMKVTTHDFFTKVDIYCPQTKTFYQDKGSNKDMLWRRRFWEVEPEADLPEPASSDNFSMILDEYEKMDPTFDHLPPFDETEDYLNHIKLELSVEKMKEDIRQLLESLVSENLLSKEEQKNIAIEMEDQGKKIADLELKAEEPFIVLMCGQTGSGKSTLSTVMTGNKYKDFKISNDSSNLTVECENNGKDGHPFLGIEGSCRKIRIIDAPGLGNLLDSQISDESVVKEVKDYMGERNLQNTDQISALLWIEDANSFQKGARMRVERYIRRISPEAMKIIIMIFNKDFDDDDDSLVTLTKTFKTALSTAAKKQFAMSENELNQSIDNIPCILLKQCDELVKANQLKEEVLEEFIVDNKEQLEKLLQCVRENHTKAIGSFKVFSRS